MRRCGSLGNNKGVALVAVVVILIMLALIGSYVINITYNQKRMVNISSGQKIRIYYNAQAGIVDANWRIRNNKGDPANTFLDWTNPGTTLTYTLNDGTIHADITIGALGAALNGNPARVGIRNITVVGKDA